MRHILAEVSFGEWLKRRRKAEGLTQEQLAQQLSCSTITLRKIEAEERRPSEQIVRRLAEIFEIPSNEQTAFLRFARGDWQAAPIGAIEKAPWLVSPLREHNDPSNPKTQLITFLFTDIEDSAKLWESAPEQMKVALERHHEILEEAVSTNGGMVFQIVGDAFCAAFTTTPSTISAAVTAQSQLYQEEWDLPFPIRVRMGIHTGDAERTSNDSPTGGYASNQTLNRVARILSAGHGGQILLSLATKELVKDSLPAGTELRDMGEHHLKNLIRPEHLFQLEFAGLPSDFPPLNTLTRRHNLPFQLTSFIGREQEIIQVREYLSNDDIRLITLIGPPGIGKTRLSIEAARVELSGFPDGVFFVALAPLEDPNLVAPTIGQSLGFVEATDQSPLKRLENGIGDKQMLIVLDNVEHLIEGTAALVSDLLSACSGLKILSTSREALRVPGEWLYQVPALSIPAETQLQSIDIETATQFAALKLFAERAHAVRSDFALNTENALAVAAICTQLDGLPLAIELIAARIRWMSPQSLLSRLSEQFTQYADGMRAVSARQKTLHNAIGWSYDLLPAKEQVLFRRLAAFVGGWTLEGAQAICAGDGLEADEIPDLLMHLVDKSLVILREQGGEQRYQILETIRQYAREKLWAAGEGETLRQRHLAYFVALAEQAEPNLRAFDMVIWLDRLEAELDNIRAALGWAIESDVEAQLSLASALLWFWHIRGHKNEGINWLERGLSIEAAERGGQPLPTDRAMIRGKALNVVGFLLGMSGNFEKRVALSKEALAVFRKLGLRGRLGMAYAVLNLARAAAHQGDSRQVKVLVEESLTLLREAGDKFGIAQCLDILGWVKWVEGDSDQAKALLEENLALRKEIGDKDGIGWILTRLATRAFLDGDLSRSVTIYEESLAAFREVGNEWAIGITLADLARVAQAQGDYGKASKILEEGLTLGRDLGEKFPISQWLYSLGGVAQSQGDYERATQIYEEALILAREVGDPDTIARNLAALGNVALARGDYEQATKQFESELSIGQEREMNTSSAFALCRLGRIAWAQGDFELASKRLEEALSIIRETGNKIGAGFALYCLGRVSQSQRDYASAQTHYTESLALARELGFRDGIASNLEALATLSVAKSQMESSPLRFEDLRRATRLFGKAEALHPPLLFEMSAAERAEHDRAVASARATLDEEAFVAAMEEGRAMTMEQAIAYALEL